jgi:tetratricopeptide (TPR) repeat protein
MPAIFIFSAGALEMIFRIWEQRRWHIFVIMILLLGVLGFAINMPFLDQEGKNYHMATAHSNFGNLLGRLEDFEGAAGEYSVALSYFKAASPYRAHMAEKLGVALIDAQKYDASIAAFEEAESIVPDTPSIANSLATAYTALGQYKEAIRYREKAIDLSPENEEYHFNFGSTLLWAGQDKKAEKEFLETIRLNLNYRKKVDARREYILKNRKRVTR